MPITLIHQFPTEKRTPLKDGAIIKIAEMFGDTIQGENFAGIASTFLRVEGCTLECVWCDTLEVWRTGDPYSTTEILDIFEENGFVEKFKNGQHLILTGGSPLKQQTGLKSLINDFITRFGFKPYIEIENETVLPVDPEFAKLVDCWNNSPKLANSGMKERVRYKTHIIKEAASFPNSWFKFVVASEEDWAEIKKDFLDTNLIDKDQIVVMPEGQTRSEIQQHYESAVNIAVRENVRFSDRLHITIWDKKVGV